MPTLRLKDNNLGPLFILVPILAFATVLALPACNINVKKSQPGQENNVDIETPVGGIHVSKHAEVRDLGLPVYPGARRKPKGEDGNETNADVSLSSSFFGLHVAAIEYTADDPPEKVVAYYKDQLKKYGDVLECHTSRPHPGSDLHPEDNSQESKQLKCEGDDSGKTIELKVGTKQNQHIVAIQPGPGKGTDFGLIYIQLHAGKETI
jgi:hypothetical protein